MKIKSKPMYFEISDSEAVAKLDKALKPAELFDEKLYTLQVKYKVDTPYVFNSLDRGLEFSCFWFKEYPLHLDTEKEFKISTEKHKPGYEIRPRLSNKKFCAEFFKDMQNVTYDELKMILYGDKHIRPTIEFLKVGDAYYLASNANILLPNKELTASQYTAALERIKNDRYTY